MHPAPPRRVHRQLQPHKPWCSPHIEQDTIPSEVHPGPERCHAQCARTGCQVLPGHAQVAGLFTPSDEMADAIVAAGRSSGALPAPRLARRRGARLGLRFGARS